MLKRLPVPPATGSALGNRLLRALRRERLAMLSGLAVLAVASTVVVARGENIPAVPDRSPPVAASQPPDEPVPSHPGIAVTNRTATVRTAPDSSAPPVSRLRPGIPLPVLNRVPGHLAVQTPCHVEGWVAEADVQVHSPGGESTPRDLRRATFVLDAGHGGAAPGAVGPTGLTEAEVNLDIVRRLAEQLSRSRDVDWTTGRITSGAAYGPPRVVLTRDADDHLAGLAYRAQLANTIRADAFVSIHNNAEPDAGRLVPGTETYYQQHSPESKRLAGLAYEEVFGALRAIEGVSWVGDRDAGAKYRANARGEDYYGLLRRSEVPATLVEAAFISNPQEEALLRRPDVRQTIADAVYRALVRFVTTDDPGSGFVEPYPRGDVPSGGLPSTCVDPA